MIYIYKIITFIVFPFFVFSVWYYLNKTKRKKQSQLIDIEEATKVLNEVARGCVKLGYIKYPYDETLMYQNNIERFLKDYLPKNQADETIKKSLNELILKEIEIATAKRNFEDYIKEKGFKNFFIDDSKLS